MSLKYALADQYLEANTHALYKFKMPNDVDHYSDLVIKVVPSDERSDPDIYIAKVRLSLMISE